MSTKRNPIVVSEKLNMPASEYPNFNGCSILLKTFTISDMSAPPYELCFTFSANDSKFPKLVGDENPNSQ